MSVETEQLVVRRSVRVARPVDEAFRVFTEEIGNWWPLASHSRASERDGVEAETAVLESRAGGRLFERISDGSEADWGTVTAWEPPSRVAFAWHVTGIPTHVDVRFTPDGGGTRVELEHTGFDGIPEGERRSASYDEGWGAVLARYADYSAS